MRRDRRKSPKICQAMRLYSGVLQHGRNRHRHLVRSGKGANLEVHECNKTFLNPACRLRIRHPIHLRLASLRQRAGRDGAVHLVHQAARREPPVRPRRQHAPRRRRQGVRTLGRRLVPGEEEVLDLLARLVPAPAARTTGCRRGSSRPAGTRRRRTWSSRRSRRLWMTWS